MQPPCSRLYRHVSCCFTKSNWTPLRIHCMLPPLGGWILAGKSHDMERHPWGQAVPRFDMVSSHNGYRPFAHAFGLVFLVSARCVWHSISECKDHDCSSKPCQCDISRFHILLPGFSKAFLRVFRLIFRCFLRALMLCLFAFCRWAVPGIAFYFVFEKKKAWIRIQIKIQIRIQKDWTDRTDCLDFGETGSYI